jgi:putative ATP-binding cassette transporter
LLLGIALVAIIGATAFAQIKLNAWNQPFFDALSRKSLGEFFAPLSVFAFIAGGLLILKVAETWFSQTMKVKLREGLVIISMPLLIGEQPCSASPRFVRR